MSESCCYRAHAQAVPPWTCDCVCHAAKPESVLSAAEGLFGKLHTEALANGCYLLADELADEDIKQWIVALFEGAL